MASQADRMHDSIGQPRRYATKKCAASCRMTFARYLGEEAGGRQGGGVGHDFRQQWLRLR